MTVHTESRVIDAPQGEVFDLVADVERYPEFLPMWREAKIVGRRGNCYRTEQEIGLGPICRRFETRTVLTRPSRIEVTSVDRLFRDFLIRWDFAPLTPTSCQVSIALKWRVRSGLLQAAIDLVLADTARNMIAAFQERAARGGAATKRPPKGGLLS